MWDSFAELLLLLALGVWLALWILRESGALGIRRGLNSRGRPGRTRQPTSAPAPPGAAPSREPTRSLQ